jgi:ABC-2 type transport system ATP-binding protein
MALVIEHLGRRYGDRWAISDLSLVCEGGMLGLVGPNGAGKTTLMRIIATLLPPTTGSVRWNGLDVGASGQQIRARLGYLPQQFGVYPEFSGRRFLRYLAALKGLARPRRDHRVDEVLELVNLEAEADRRLSTYSGGMLQRIGIAQALLNDPELLVVDEPTAGLDPSERVRFRTLLAGLTANRLVILSTHIVSDVEAVAGRLVVMRGGAVVADTSPDALLAAAAGSVWAVSVDPATAKRLQATETVSGMVSDGQRVTVRIVSRTTPPGAWPVEPTLEDAYLLTVGRPAAA